jgi:hypothetical protein
MATRSKLSSVSWNAYVRSRLVTADYDGLIQLWDAGAGGAELSHFDEHARRVWSVDFSRQDPTRFLSGSDDGTGGRGLPVGIAGSLLGGLSACARAGLGGCKKGALWGRPKGRAAVQVR